MAFSIQLKTVGTRIIAPSSGMASGLESSILYVRVLDNMRRSSSKTCVLKKTKRWKRLKAGALCKCYCSHILDLNFNRHIDTIIKPPFQFFTGVYFWCYSASDSIQLRQETGRESDTQQRLLGLGIEPATCCQRLNL